MQEGISKWCRVIAWPAQWHLAIILVRSGLLNCNYFIYLQHSSDKRRELKTTKRFSSYIFWWIGCAALTRSLARTKKRNKGNPDESFMVDVELRGFVAKCLRYSRETDQSETRRKPFWLGRNQFVRARQGDTKQEVTVSTTATNTNRKGFLRYICWQSTIVVIDRYMARFGRCTISSICRHVACRLVRNTSSRLETRKRSCEGQLFQAKIFSWEEKDLIQ
jgi:hypothetical protein